jgi:hypothetical protein
MIAASTASSGPVRRKSNRSGGRTAADRSTAVKWFLRKKSRDVGQAACPESKNPLPWRNQPSGGLNHVADANGRPVYDGSDAAEMFRLYSAETQASRAAGRR